MEVGLKHHHHCHSHHEEGWVGAVALARDVSGAHQQGEEQSDQKQSAEQSEFLHDDREHIVGKCQRQTAALAGVARQHAKDASVGLCHV